MLNYVHQYLKIITSRSSLGVGEDNQHSRYLGRRLDNQAALIGLIHLLIMLMSIKLAAIMNEISRVVISLRALAIRSVSSDTSSLMKGMFFERSMRVRTTECLCWGWWCDYGRR